MPSIEISSMSSSASTSSGAVSPSTGARLGSMLVDETTFSVTVEVMAPPGFGGASCSHSSSVVGRHHTVSPLFLGRIESTVGGSEGLEHGPAVDVDGNPGAERHSRGRLHPGAGDALDRGDGRRRAAGQQQQELLAAEPRQVVVAADVPGEMLGERPQRGITGGMTAGVVDLLEVVDVDEDESVARRHRGEEAVG